MTVDQALINNADAAITIDDVSLIGADGLAIEESFLLPVIQLGKAELLIGSSGDFPPPAVTDPDSSSEHVREAWAQREETLGAEIQPGETLDLAVGLRVTHDGTVSMEAIEVLYTVHDGNSYRDRSTTEIEVLVGKSSCHGF